MLDGKRIAVLAEEGFEDSELIEPVRAMKNAGAKVVIVGSGSQESYRGKKGNAIVHVDAPVAQDGNLITSRKPADLPRFNKAIIEALQT